MIEEEKKNVLASYSLEHLVDKGQVLF